MAKRIAPDDCCGVIVDVQEFFLAQVDKRLRARLRTNTANFARLLGYFRIPVVVTIERPVERKGILPATIAKHLGPLAETFEKDSFDLCREPAIRNHIAGLKKKQMIVAGCETDVCVLQSCLGLLDVGYQVFAVEELLFSSAGNVEAAVARLKSEGVVFLTYKTLFYELLEAVGGGPHAQKVLAQSGEFPDIPDAAV
jgi:nicotinamidase-related amidase